MAQYLTTFLVSLASAGAVMLVVSLAMTDSGKRRKCWRLALGVTLADVVTGVFHPFHDRLVRALTCGLCVGFVPLLMDKIFARYHIDTRSERNLEATPSMKKNHDE